MIQKIQGFTNVLTKIQPLKNTQIPRANVNFMTKPDIFVKSTENVAFTGGKEEVIRSLGNIECPCCGVKMLSIDDFDRIKGKIGENGSSAHAIKVLGEYEEYMHPVEKECFHLLKGLSEKNPDQNLKQLLRSNMKPYFERLKATENKVFDEVDALSKSLPANEVESVKKLTDLNRKILSQNERDIKFKRKNFIADVKDLKISDKEVHKKMNEAAEKLPSSQNNVDAFVIKYASREHGEIAQRLLKLSVGTIEHIKPQSKGGRNDVNNYLLECGGCNHVRSSIPLDEWVNAHPEMKENTQKYIEKAIDFIAKGGMKGHEDYPEKVAATLRHESKGTIDLNLDKLEELEEKEEASREQVETTKKTGKTKRPTRR